MSIGIVETFIRVHRLGKIMHPKLTTNNIKHRIILLVRTLVFIRVVRWWYDISDNPLMIRALQRFPLMSGAMYWPYINHTWPMKRRLATIYQHFRLLEGSANVVAHATFVKVDLASLELEYTGLCLALDKAEWFLREGEVVLNLFVHDQRLYSIAFTLNVTDGVKLILVGALQGSNLDTAREIYRNLTHALHGMRPRDFLMVALKQLCGELDVSKIWAISSDNRQHNGAYFGRSHQEKVLVAYNEVWSEHGGVALGNGFFEIPVTVTRKNLVEIPSRKRATYRRRYEMLDRLALDIKKCCARYETQELPEASPF